MSMNGSFRAMAAALFFGAVPVAQAVDSQPFTLVNIIDLFEAHTFDTGIVTCIDYTPIPFITVTCGADPGNVPPVSELRLGTNPSAVATDGQRAWIGGHWNGTQATLNGGTGAVPGLHWYNSIGVGEITNIYGGSFPLPLVRYEETFLVGPSVTLTEWYSGLDYDESSQTLLITFDNSGDFASPDGLMELLNPPQAQSNGFVAAVDVNTSSLTYTQMLWKIEEPVPTSGSPKRLTAGAAFDVLDPNWFSVASFDRGNVFFYDSQNLGNPPVIIDIFDDEGEDVLCPSTALLSHNYDPISGDFYIRARGGILRVPRDTSGGTSPYTAFSRAIVEPDGGNGTADTLAQGDDVQEANVGNPVAAGAAIVSFGPNMRLDTPLGGDDVFSSNVLLDSVVGNTPDSFNGCGDDPDGFLYTNVTQGQGLAYIESDNLVDLDEDLILASGRATFGANQLKDVRFFNTNGDPVAELELPCSPVPTSSNGLAFYDIDYHAPSGTLVVLEFEQRKLYVFKAQVIGGPAFPQFDWSRNGSTDLFDMGKFQDCYTGPEFAGGLSLNCQRLNSDSDCDIDLDDWFQMSQAVTGPGGP